ncbi:MAG: alpha/beta hydrolase [Clostridia bacterium]|nr:alpha/beta hydrolase [Clostridia bacterium]
MDIFIYVLTAIIAIVLLTSYICFLKVFRTPKRKKLGKGEYDLPPGDIYEPFYPQMREWIDSIRGMKRELFEIESFDGLKLRGYYYEYSPDSPLELIFHGYGGNAERDLSGGVERCFALGRSAVLIDQRGAGMSEGRICSFGINERLDCLEWIKFATRKFGKDRPLIIGGVSMGAATVMMASGEDLPKNVACVMADCGYSSSKKIIKKVVREMKLPPSLVYPFIRLGGMLYGKFDIEETDPVSAVARSKTPIVYIHGDEDDFVPHSMSVECFEATRAPKKLVTIEGAGHGLGFPQNQSKYVESLRDFETEANIFGK